MCAVSAIYDYWGRQPIDIWTRPTFNELQEIIRRLDSLDHKLDQPECHEPSKADWMKKVEERLHGLEGLKGGLT